MERDRLEKLKTKLNHDIDALNDFCNQFQYFVGQFNEQADFNLNKAQYSKFLRALERIKE